MAMILLSVLVEKVESIYHVEEAFVNGYFIHLLALSVYLALPVAEQTSELFTPAPVHVYAREAVVATAQLPLL
jgi:hypothetical protein